MKILMSNQDIYINANNLRRAFGDSAEQKIVLPILINYAIQKNLKILTNLAIDIEQMRLDIGAKYGVLTEIGDYKILPENMEQAKKDIAQLMEIEEKVDIKTIKLGDLGELALSNSQMAALLFMIEEE